MHEGGRSLTPQAPEERQTLWPLGDVLENCTHGTACIISVVILNIIIIVVTTIYISLLGTYGVRDAKNSDVLVEFST